MSSVKYYQFPSLWKSLRLPHPLLLLTPPSFLWILMGDYHLFSCVTNDPPIVQVAVCQHKAKRSERWLAPPVLCCIVNRADIHCSDFVIGIKEYRRHVEVHHRPLTGRPSFLIAVLGVSTKRGLAVCGAVQTERTRSHSSEICHYDFL